MRLYFSLCRYFNCDSGKGSLLNHTKIVKPNIAMFVIAACPLLLINQWKKVYMVIATSKRISIFSY